MELRGSSVSVEIFKVDNGFVIKWCAPMLRGAAAKNPGTGTEIYETRDEVAERIKDFLDQ